MRESLTRSKQDVLAGRLRPVSEVTSKMRALIGKAARYDGQANG